MMRVSVCCFECMCWVLVVGEEGRGRLLTRCKMNIYFFFFFQAEDGIRDLIVTGVQTCALPIFKLSKSETDNTLKINKISSPEANYTSSRLFTSKVYQFENFPEPKNATEGMIIQIGRASCRERV